MASLRNRNDKKLVKLKQESKKLHAEVEALEDALMLHQRYKEEDDNSVKGILRKEIGGSRWQHGGSGKLQSYRTAKDLEDPDSNTAAKRRKRRNKIEQNGTKENQTSKMGSEPSEKLIEPSTKSLGGFPSKDKLNNDALNSDTKVKLVNQKSAKSGMAKDINIDSNLKIDSDKVTALKSKVLEKASAGVIHRKHNPKHPPSDTNKVKYNEGENVKITDHQTVRNDALPKKQEITDKGLHYSNYIGNYTNRVKFTTESPEKVNNYDIPPEMKAGNSKLKQTNIKPSQALERSRDKEVFKILSLPSNQRSSQSVETKSLDDGLANENNFNNSASLSASILKCDPQMKEWVKSLGLLEEEKYLKIFADHEIDMKEIPELTALQLNEMGITAFGALNKIVRGIKELKQKTQSQTKVSVDSKSLKSVSSSQNPNSSLKSDNGETKTKNDLSRSKTFEERLNSINQYRTSLRRSRSFASSASQALYSSNNVRTSLDDGLASRLQINNALEHKREENSSELKDSLSNKKSEVKSVKSNEISKETNALAEEKTKTLRKRSNSPARRPASCPVQRKAKTSEAESLPKKKTEIPSGQKSSLSRQGSEGSPVKKSPLTRQGSGKSKNVPVLWPRAKSAQIADKKAKEGVAAAAKKYTEKQKRDMEKEKQQNQAKLQKKVQRDEMAARHEQRQQAEDDDEDIYEDRSDELNKEYERERQDLSDLDLDISKLISVTVLDNSTRKDYPEEKYREDKPKERTRPRSSHHARKSIHNPVYLQANFTGTQVKGRQSKQNEVKSIESQIEALQSKALSGEMVTMDLVKDLQQRLEEIEQQIRDTRPPKTRSKQRNAGPKQSAVASTRGKDVVIKKDHEQTEFRVDPRDTRSPEVTNIDPVRSVEINTEDIMFDVSDLIGEGTFCKVYHGLCLGKEVAVKQLKIPLTSHDKNYFAAEVSLLKELHHPRVVQLVGVCTKEKYPVMVLEFMARGSLYHILHDPKCESMDHAAYYGVSHDIALGMNYLHQHKPQVLHLDLKSMNVLLDISGRAKIADFGFSKFRHDADLRASKASKKKASGSPIWMAPELLETGEITTKADVYSFGIILWEMLTRSCPYEGCSVFQILERVRLNKRPEIPDSCPPDLSGLIQRCWDQNPARRPAFKDIIIQLDKLAFPPDWRALFKEAGVPNEALEDPQSARTIISLVNNTVDLANVKSMMEDIKHSNDVIRASHDITRKSHVSNNQSKDFPDQPYSSLNDSYNIVVQSREPQRSIPLSRRSYDQGRQSIEKVRTSGGSILSRKSSDSPFSSRNKHYTENNVRDSIEEDIVENEDIRDSFDFKFSTKFNENFNDFDEHSDDTLFQKSQNSFSGVRKSGQEEDTTAEYLNYLKTSCEILSPIVSSPVKHYPDLQELLAQEAEKADNTGTVIETIATIPYARSPQTSSRKSPLSNKETDNLVSRSKDIKQTDSLVKSSSNKSKDKPEGAKKENLSSSIHASHDKLLEEISKSKTEKEKLLRKEIEKPKPELTCTTKKEQSTSSLPKEDTRSSLLKEIRQSKVLKESFPRKEASNIEASPRLINQEELKEKVPKQEKPSIKPRELSLQSSQEMLLKEMLNSKAYSRREDIGRRSHDHFEKELKTKNEKKDSRPNPLSMSMDAGIVNLRKHSKDERMVGLKFTEKVPKSIVNEKTNSDTVDSKDQVQHETCKKSDDTDSVSQTEKMRPKIDVHSLRMSRDKVLSGKGKKEAVSGKEKKIDVKTMNRSGSENVLDEIKNLHSKLRSEKNENVEEIKMLHTKLRSCKIEKSDSEKCKSELNEKSFEAAFDDVLDSIEQLDCKDASDISVDSLDLNDSIVENTSHVTNQDQSHVSFHGNVEKDELLEFDKGEIVVKGKTKKEINDVVDKNENAKILPESEVTGIRKNAEALPDLRMSLNMEIAHFSLNKQKEKMKKVKTKDVAIENEKTKMDKLEVKKTKPKKLEKKPKSVKEKKSVDNTVSFESKKKSEAPSEQPRKSIEAWVEEKVETQKPKQRKISTSNLPSHPPPILIPDERPVSMASPREVPEAPPIPPPPPPPIPPVEITPPTLEQDEPPSVITNGAKKKKVTFPEAKVSNEEAQASNSSKSTLAKGDDSGQLVLKSTDLREQKEVLQSISKPHPNQLQDLSQVNKQTYTSIADILKRAVFNRREAMGEDSPSPSVASSWSFVDD